MPQQADDRARHTLTVHDVAHLLTEAGVARSERRIKHFCQIGTLTAKKFPTPTGPQWFVDPTSVPGVIGDLKQFNEQIRSRLEHAATDPVTVKDEPIINSDAAGSSMPQPAASHPNTEPTPQSDGGMTQPAAAAYVSQLEKRIEEKDDVIGLLKGQLIAKDEQISEFSTRYRETHSLLGAMQRMLAPLLGQSDPYHSPEKRDAMPTP